MHKYSGPRRLAELVPACVGPAAAERGFATAELLSRWPQIAGAQFGTRSRPVRFSWPPRGQASDPAAGPGGAVLHVKVENGFAMALQYESEALIARINAYLGWRCVQAIRFKQGPVGNRGAAAAPPAALDPAADMRLARSLDGVDETLAAPLRRLGRAVLAGRTAAS